jgi:hypothetical protein
MLVACVGRQSSVNVGPRSSFDRVGFCSGEQESYMARQVMGLDQGIRMDLWIVACTAR